MDAGFGDGVSPFVRFLIPVSHLLLAVNCSINLFIYCVCNNQFRRAAETICLRNGAAGGGGVSGLSLCCHRAEKMAALAMRKKDRGKSEDRPTPNVSFLKL